MYRRAYEGKRAEDGPRSPGRRGVGARCTPPRRRVLGRDPPAHGRRRPRAPQAQAGVELRLARVTLFRFGAPRIATTDGAVECSLPIVGGLLAKEEGGFLTFVQRTAPTLELEVSVTDYVPFFSSNRTRRSVRRFLYRQVQERAHSAISHGYLARLAGTLR